MARQLTIRRTAASRASRCTTVRRTVAPYALAFACIAICAGPLHSGEIAAWGNDVFGQVSGTPLGDDYTAVVAGGWHGYALRADGTIAAWGNDDSGQVSNTPAGTFTKVASGGFTGYALAADGSISAWGYNGFGGQVMNAPTGTGFTTIAGGYDHAYALAANGSIAAWGLDADGQVSSTPTGTGFTAVAAGEDHGYALRPDGSIAAWGRDDDGEVSSAPTGTGFVAIAAGGHHGYALAADGSITAWGSDTFGQVSSTPTGLGFSAIAAGGSSGYAIAPDGTVAAWGLSVQAPPTESGVGSLTGGRNHAYVLRLAPSFCDAADGALAACPCLNPGLPDTGCDLPQGTGGVSLTLVTQRTGVQNRATWLGTGFPGAGSPTSVVIRSTALDPASPVVFGDGLRCIGAPLVRLAATFAAGGSVTHAHGHGALAGSGTFYYQLWFRSTPIMFCDPTAAFNLSNGRELSW